MLSEHPEVATTSEPWIALHPIYALRESGIQSEFDSPLAKRALNDFLQQLNLNEKFYQNRIATMLSSIYFAAAAGRKYFLDKTPRYYEIAFDLAELFPNAKFIILFRNPLAVFNSILKGWDFKDWEGLGRNYRDLRIAPQKMVDFCERFAGRVYALKYESLIQNPEKEIKNVCEYLGIQYSKDMLNINSEKMKGWALGDQNIKKTKKLQNDSTEKWKTSFKDYQSLYFANCYVEELGKDLLMKMGYDYNEMINFSKKASYRKFGIMPWTVVMDGKKDLEGLLEYQYYKVVCLNKFYVILAWPFLFARKTISFLLLMGSAAHYCRVNGLIKTLMYFTKKNQKSPNA